MTAQSAAAPLCQLDKTLLAQLHSQWPFAVMEHLRFVFRAGETSRDLSQIRSWRWVCRLVQRSALIMTWPTPVVYYWPRSKFSKAHSALSPPEEVRWQLGFKIVQLATKKGG